jgi:hypothetical protein
VSRFLQTEATSIPNDGSNSSQPLANETTSSSNATNDPSQRNLSPEDLLLFGNWKLIVTNCKKSSCIPQIFAPADVDLSAPLLTAKVRQFRLIVTVPNNTACGSNSGKTFNITETNYNGFWLDVDSNSPLYGYSGLKFLNNGTVLVVVSDFVTGSQCWQLWGNENSTYSSNSPPPTAKAWEGAWTPQSWIAATIGDESRLCCLPAQPVLLKEDLETQTINFLYYSADCEACSPFNNTVRSHNVSVVGGGGYDADDINKGFSYLVDGQFVYATSLCTIRFKKVEPKSCPNNTTVSTVPPKITVDSNDNLPANDDNNIATDPKSPELPANDGTR